VVLGEYVGVVPLVGEAGLLAGFHAFLWKSGYAPLAFFIYIISEFVHVLIESIHNKLLVFINIEFFVT